MDRRLLCLLVCLTILLFASLAFGDAVLTEVYRSPHGWPADVAVDPSDGSCWAITGISVVHLDAEGHVVQEFTHFSAPTSLAVNTADGSCWVADCCPQALVHLARDGSELWRGASWFIRDLEVNPTDGSVWLSTSYIDATPNAVIHIASDGQELLRIEAVTTPVTIAVNPNDGACWVYDYSDAWYGLKHFATDGTLLWDLPEAGYCLSLNSADGSLWTGSQTRLYHISAENEILWSSTAYGDAVDLAANPNDGTCWYRRFASPVCGEALVLLSVDGTEVRRIAQGTGGEFGTLALNPTDGSLWAGAAFGLVHLAADGRMLWQDRGLPRPFVAAVNPSDGSYWLAGGGECWGTQQRTPWVARYDSLGNELWRQGVPGGPVCVNSDPVDDSVWVADHAAISHFAANGAPLPFSATYGISGPNYVMVDPRDRSLWVSDTNSVNHYGPDATLLQSIAYDGLIYNAQVAPDGSLWALGFYLGSYSDWPRLVHIAANGTWTNVPGIVELSSFSVNAGDGTVWACDTGREDDIPLPSRVSHLAADGSVLWQGGTDYDAVFVAVDPRNGNCWVVGNDVYLLAPDGDQLGRGGPDLGRGSQYFVTVNAADGTLWMLDEASQLRKIACSGPFSDVAVSSWATPASLSCVAADIVQGYGDGTYRPEYEIARDQMAVYVARALAGGEELVPPGPSTATFSDVPISFWAFNHVEYAVDRGVVQGYDDGTYHPAEVVDRGQMAVFLARAMAGGDALVPDGPVTPSFSDVPSDFWAYKHVEYLRRQYVVRGYWDGTYRPASACTRDQMAVFVTRAFHLFR